MEHHDLSNQGGFSPGKDFLYAINFEWNEGKWAYAEIDNLLSFLTMNSSQNLPIEIKRIKPDTT